MSLLGIFSLNKTDPLHTACDCSQANVRLPNGNFSLKVAYFLQQVSKAGSATGGIVAQAPVTPSHWHHLAEIQGRRC